MISNVLFLLLCLTATYICINRLKQMDGAARPIVLAVHVISGTCLSLLTLCAVLKLIL